MSVFSYYKNSLISAITATLHYFDIRNWQAWLHILAPAAIVLFLQWRILNFAEFITEFQKWLIVVGASLSWALLIFISQIFLSPYRMQRDAAKKTNELERQLRELRAAQEPRMLIRFGANPPFVQISGPNVSYRIGIQNLSAALSIENASVELEELEPNPPPFLPVRLHLTHDNVPDAHHQRSFDLAPNQTQFVDVLTIENHPGEIRYNFHHIVNGVSGYIGPNVERLRITARARNCPEVSARFNIIHENNSWTLIAAG